MGWIVVNRWDRRDTASREDFGAAAFKLCRAAKTHPAIKSARYYWANADQIVTANETDDLSAYWAGGNKEVGAALFAMADLARSLGTETWIDAGQGTATYKDAGR